jgi:hypothetical protein
MTRVLAFSTLALFSAGCATAVGQMNITNPALSADTTEATQSYEVPPYRGDHRFEATLAKWTPGGLEFRLSFVNAEKCGLPSSYEIALVDDLGRRYAFQPLEPERSIKRAGHLGATLFDGVVTGRFPVSVDARTRSVTLEIRPRDDRACSPMNFRWSFVSPAG